MKQCITFGSWEPIDSLAGGENVALETAAGLQLQPSRFLVVTTLPNLNTEGFCPLVVTLLMLFMLLNTEALNSLY